MYLRSVIIRWSSCVRSCLIWNVIKRTLEFTLTLRQYSLFRMKVYNTMSNRFPLIVWYTILCKIKKKRRCETVESTQRLRKIVVSHKVSISNEHVKHFIIWLDCKITLEIRHNGLAFYTTIRYNLRYFLVTNHLRSSRLVITRMIRWFEFESLKIPHAK